MSDHVRPRINKNIYELVKSAASASCVSTTHWLVEAIIEKAEKEGFEIVDSKVACIQKVMSDCKDEPSANHNHYQNYS
jgi:uncharacterized protein (DUF1778 family)